MHTKVVRGFPKELLERKMMRIKEAKKFKNNHELIDRINGIDIFFDRPGRDIDKYKYDMIPGVGDRFANYQFKQIWNDMLNICFHLNEDLFKKLMVILYRMAYLMDYKIIQGKVRFYPSDEIIDVLNEIQNILYENDMKYDILELLYFIDLLSWNEDMRYYVFGEDKKRGRINCIYGIITVTHIYRDFCISVLKCNNRNEIDLSSLLTLNQNFVHGRGMISCSDLTLVTWLSPYLYS